MIFRHLWGLTEPWDTLFPTIHGLGYQGIEHILPDKPDRQRFRSLLDRLGFEYIAQVITSGNTVDDHVRNFREVVGDAGEMKPRNINCHSGCDWFSEEEARRFFSTIPGQPNECSKHILRSN
jgi:sugar phosphate isomerase/epimerase